MSLSLSVCSSIGLSPVSMLSVSFVHSVLLELDVSICSFSCVARCIGFDSGR